MLNPPQFSDMDWLFHNAIADLRGPQFLLFYALVITVTICWAKYAVNKQDLTGNLPPAPIPATIDPYELAYLRAGEHEVLRLALVSLIQRGYLRRGNKKGALG